MNRHRSNIGRKAYSVLAKRTKQSAKSDNAKWLEEQCINIQQSFDQAKTKKAHHLIKKIRKKYVPRTSCIKDKTTNSLSVKPEVID